MEVKVWGEFACFTRPEMKVERVTYPVMTPSAARGVLESVFWKPEFHWEVEEVWVLRPIRYFSILRNEINSPSDRPGSPRDGKGREGGFGATADRAQRHTLALRDVAYIIRARPIVREGVPEDPAKYRDQFRRRVKDGRCFATPYLGCREFSAWFSATKGDEAPLEINEDLGNMLLCLDYLPEGSGSAIPRFFHAELKGGVLKVPKASPEEA